MKLTIRWLLEHNSELKGFFCLAGEQGIDRQIAGINIMDNPDTVPWLKTDELILSTGYIFTSTDIYKTIIQNLYDQGCCGLGIKMNRYMDTLPQEMIEQADALGFTIFSIPFTSTMEQIVNLVYRQMFSNEMSESERMVTFYKQITEAVLKRHNAQPVLESITDAIQVPAFLTDPGFEIIEYHIPEQSGIAFPLPYSKDSNSLFSEIDSIFLQNEYTTNPLPVRKHSVTFENTTHHYVIFSIVHQKSLLGYLVCLEENAPFSSFEYELISNIHSILCIIMMKTNMAADGQQIDRTTFFNELLSGSLKTDLEIESLCTQYGFNFSSPRICVSIHIDGYEEMSASRQRAFMRKIINSIQQALLDPSLEFTHTTYANNLVLFLFLRKIPSAQRLETVAAHMDQIIGKFHSENIYLLAGLSCCLSGASTICTSYTQSVRALELGRKLHPNEKVFSYEKDRIYHILSSSFTASQLIDYYNAVLKPLDDYDAENGSSLSSTLFEYLQCGQNIARAAKQLYIHRNTMIYRMDQIQSIIRFDSKNPDSLYLIRTAFYIKKLLFL